MTPLELSCLKLIAEKDGEIGWYQLDRLLTLRGTTPRDLMSCIRNLSERGLISASGPIDQATTRYFVTDNTSRALSVISGSGR